MAPDPLGIETSSTRTPPDTKWTEIMPRCYPRPGPERHMAPPGDDSASLHAPCMHVDGSSTSDLHTQEHVPRRPVRPPVPSLPGRTDSGNFRHSDGADGADGAFRMCTHMQTGNPTAARLKLPREAAGSGRTPPLCGTPHRSPNTSRKSALTL